jgi:hypothetical protein
VDTNGAGEHKQHNTCRCNVIHSEHKQHTQHQGLGWWPWLGSGHAAMRGRAAPSQAHQIAHARPDLNWSGSNPQATPSWAASCRSWCAARTWPSAAARATTPRPPSSSAPAARCRPSARLCGTRAIRAGPETHRHAVWACGRGEPARVARPPQKHGFFYIKKRSTGFLPAWHAPTPRLESWGWGLRAGRASGLRRMRGRVARRLFERLRSAACGPAPFGRPHLMLTTHCDSTASFGCVAAAERWTERVAYKPVVRALP